MSRFTIRPGQWYACEIIGDEFLKDKCSYSPIKVHRVDSKQTGQRLFTLHFYHANYPEGVREKQYELQTIERGETFLLAKSTQHAPPRFLQVYEITPQWVENHFDQRIPTTTDIQTWLDRNAYT